MLPYPRTFSIPQIKYYYSYVDNKNFLGFPKKKINREIVLCNRMSLVRVMTQQLFPFPDEWHLFSPPILFSKDGIHYSSFDAEGLFSFPFLKEEQCHTHAKTFYLTLPGTLPTLQYMLVSPE